LLAELVELKVDDI